MNLRSIDLNLLVILDALLDDAHVSRAALRLNLSQPAVSSALQRCRDLFDDPLLKRGRGTMHRTPRAEALRAPLKELLTGVHDLVAPPEIPLNALQQVIRITTADDPIFLIAAPLITALQQTAPGLTIVFQPWNGADAAAEQLLKGETDIAISVFPAEVDGIEHVTVLDETYVVAMRKDHPADTPLNLTAWLAWPHIVMSGRGESQSPLDLQLRTMALARRVGVVVPSFQLIPSILAQTNHIAMVPRHGLAPHAHPELRIVEPPIEVSGFPLHLAWHQRQNKDRATQHVVAQIRAVFQSIVRHAANGRDDVHSKG